MNKLAKILIPASGHTLHAEMEFCFGNVDDSQAMIDLNLRSATGVVMLQTREGTWHGTGIPVDLDVIGGPGTHEALKNRAPFCILRRREKGRQILDLVTSVSTIQLRQKLFDRLYAIYVRTFPRAIKLLESIDHRPGDWLNVEYGFAIESKRLEEINLQIAYGLAKRARDMSNNVRYRFVNYDLNLRYLSTLVESLLLEMDIPINAKSHQPPLGPGAWLIYFLLYMHKKHNCYPSVAAAVERLQVNSLSLIERFLQQQRAANQQAWAASQRRASEVIQG